MSDLRIAEVAGTAGEVSTYGGFGIGYGVDVPAEVARLRAMLTATMIVVEELRAAHNAHTHAGAVAAPTGAEASPTPLRTV